MSKLSKFSNYIEDKKNTTENKNKKSAWQFVQFVAVSVQVSVIQILLVLLLPLLFKNITTPLTGFLGYVFTEDVIGVGNSTWGYILPYFLSVLIANAFGYSINRKKTFKSDAPKWHFILFVVCLLILIVISTWLQGVIVYFLDDFMWDAVARIIASLAAGIFLALTLFPLQKYVLLREAKK